MRLPCATTGPLTYNCAFTSRVRAKAIFPFISDPTFDVFEQYPSIDNLYPGSGVLPLDPRTNYGVSRLVQWLSSTDESPKCLIVAESTIV